MWYVWYVCVCVCVCVLVCVCGPASEGAVGIWALNYDHMLNKESLDLQRERRRERERERKKAREVEEERERETDFFGQSASHHHNRHLRSYLLTLKQKLSSNYSDKKQEREGRRKVATRSLCNLRKRPPASRKRLSPPTTIGVAQGLSGEPSGVRSEESLRNEPFELE